MYISLHTYIIIFNTDNHKIYQKSVYSTTYQSTLYQNSPMNKALLIKISHIQLFSSTSVKKNLAK